MMDPDRELGTKSYSARHARVWRERARKLLLETRGQKPRGGLRQDLVFAAERLDLYDRSSTGRALRARLVQKATAERFYGERDARRYKGLVRVVLPSGNQAIYSVTSPGESDPERIRYYHTHIATKLRGEWVEIMTRRAAHASDARAYDRAPLAIPSQRDPRTRTRASRDADPYAGAEGFVRDVERQLRIGDRHVSLRFKHSLGGSDAVYVNYVNLPKDRIRKILHRAYNFGEPVWMAADEIAFVSKEIARRAKMATTRQARRATIRRTTRRE